jgi:hypothetical protein
LQATFGPLYEIFNFFFFTTQKKNTQNWTEQRDELDSFKGNQLTKEAKFIMTITKIAAIIALAAASLSLGACCHKQCCQQSCPSSSGKSK